MAPLPSNSTGVLFVDYSTGGENHTVQLRYQDGSSVVDAMIALDEFLTALDTLISVITITGARHRLISADVTLPITWTGAATYGSGTAPHAKSAFYIDFVGRSPEGRRVRVSVFGSAEAIDLVESDYRLPASGDVLAAIEALRSNGSTICAIDGLEPIWYDYANIGINAYWRNKIR